jgi:hydroxyacylglutathione hydrolase
MKIRNIPVGPLQVNCFVVYDEERNDAIVIDPGDEPEKIVGFIKAGKLLVSSIVCTHSHFDHVGAVRKLKEATGAPVMIHKEDLDIFMHAEEQATLWGLSIEQPSEPDSYLLEGDEIVAGDLRFRVLHTPGHSPGGICLYGHNVIFTGDTIFAGSVGRTDFPGGSYDTLKKSFARIISLPPETKIFSGHGPETSVGRERTSNFFVEEL